MCDPLTIAATAFTAYTQISAGNSAARSAKMQAQNNAVVSEYNAKQLDAQANDSIQRGANDAAGKREAVRRYNATARAQAGSSGFLVDDGNYGDVNVDNVGIGEQDALTTMNNAEREAYGFKSQATGLRFQSGLTTNQAAYEASAAKRNGLLNAAGTLVTGGAQYGRAAPAAAAKPTNFGKIKWDPAPYGPYKPAGIKVY